MLCVHKYLDYAKVTTPKHRCTPKKLQVPVTKCKTLGKKDFIKVSKVVNWKSRYLRIDVSTPNYDYPIKLLATETADI